MQDFDIKLAPGDVRIINVQADYIYYRAGSAGGADAAIEFAPQAGGETIFLYPGQAYRVPPSSRGLGSSWALKNRKGEAPIIGAVILGEGEFQDNRISGAVEVIDGGKNRTMAKLAFSGWSASGSVNPNIPCVQLYNPPASGKNIVVGSMGVCSTVSNGFEVRIGGALIVGAGGNVPSKLVNAAGAAATSVAEFRAAGANGVAAISGGAIYLLNAQARTLCQWTPKEPVVITPGGWMSVFGQTTGTDAAVSVEWYEEVA